MNTAKNHDEMSDAQLDQVQIKMLRGLRNGSLLPQLLRTYRIRLATSWRVSGQR
ncbi:MAG: hypothetical protein AB7F79_01915 [Steroidobacteraceae bacterium]